VTGVEHRFEQISISGVPLTITTFWAVAAAAAASAFRWSLRWSSSLVRLLAHPGQFRIRATVERVILASITRVLAGPGRDAAQVTTKGCIELIP
jgi:hypothetical protein